MSDSVIAALRQALGASPGDAALRGHLTRLLLEAGDGVGALDLLRTWLAEDPTHQGALALAVRAADLAGDSAAAGRYQTLLNALYAYQAPAAAPAPAASAEAAAPVGAGVPDSRLNAEYWGSSPAGEGGSGSSGLTPFGERWQPVPGGVTLQDVVGMEALKGPLERTLLGPLRNPELARQYGLTGAGGCLLYGPPGCGKTHLARAVAGELGASFLEVTVADVLDMWLGNAERNVRELFESARRHAPCVLFFDEVDALGRGRQLSRHSPHSVTQTLLRELDGLGGRQGVFVLAATNAPWDVDTALKRPGRLGVNLLVPPPDLIAREDMFRRFMAGKPAAGLDTAWLARQTELYSGADIAHLCAEASERALGLALQTGQTQPVTMNDFKAALRGAAPVPASGLCMPATLCCTPTRAVFTMSWQP
ncbi:AAA family ATPase [Deinococcus lacus]|uniref:AAA family ATPase n=1 Tax=Deinococcus lacus TaxID=392561 RepID=A0ABW1YH72_9DEIO